MSKKIKVIEQFDTVQLLEELNKLNQDGGIQNSSREEIRMLLNVQGVSVDNKPRADGRWQGRIKVEDATKYVYGKSREEVILHLQRIIKFGYKPKQPTPTKKPERKEPAAAYTLWEWWDAFYRLYDEPNLKPNTREHRYWIIKKLKGMFEDRPIKKLAGMEIQEKMLADTSTRMRDEAFSFLNRALRKAASPSLGLIAVNPCESVEFKKHKGKKKRAFTPEEQGKIIAELRGTKYELLFKTAFSTGMRIGEILALGKNVVSDTKIRIEKNIVFIKGKEIMQDTTKTEAGERTAPISESLSALLLSQKEIGGRIFPYTYNAVDKWFDRLLKKLEIVGCSTHTTRRTYSTRLKEGGVPQEVITYIMGHEDEETTKEHYQDTQEHHVNSQYSRIVGIVSANFDTQFDTQNGVK